MIRILFFLTKRGRFVLSTFLRFILQERYPFLISDFNHIESLYNMAADSSLLMRILEETVPRNYHSCLTQFRSGRRRPIECYLIVCNKCYCWYSYALLKGSALHEFKKTDDILEMDVDSMTSNQANITHHRDAEVQIDVSFSLGILCSLYTKSNPNIQHSVVVDDADQLNLPFHRLSKSTRKYSVSCLFFWSIC